MKTIAWHLETGSCLCDLDGEIEVEDGATEDEIEDSVREDMWNFLSLTWEAKEKTDASPPTSPVETP